MKRGDVVTFKPRTGSRRQGVVKAIPPLTKEALVLLEGDPFPVNVKLSQLTACNDAGKVVKSPPSTSTSPPDRKERKVSKTQKSSKKPSAKQLRKDAQALGIEGYEDMSGAELAAAVEAAKAPAKAPKAAKASKAKARKAPAKKAAAKAKAPAKKASKKESKKEAPDPSVNPFRKGSNLHVMVPILKTGGKRRTMAEKLQKKITLHPYSDNRAVGLADYDKRLVLASQTMEKEFGWVVVRDGRGLDGTLKVLPPGSTKPEPKTKKAAAKTKAAAKKTTKKATKKR